MEHQQFGKIETASGMAYAMLCIDEDRSDEVMIHVWGEKIISMAVLSRGTWQDDTLTLKPRLLFYVNASSGLFPPQTLTDDERKLMMRGGAHLRLKNGELSGIWHDGDGVERKIFFDDGLTRAPALNALECQTWSEFKGWADEIRRKNNCVYFRGHGNRSFPLRTTLSRAGRHRIDRYCSAEFRVFAELAEAALGLRFNLDDPADYGTVLGLAQHHGLPTPLLDWTASPYVASFFAFADAVEMRQSRPDATHVRVFALTEEFVRGRFQSIVTVPSVHPYVASFQISPRNNSRLLAQQGRFLASNLTNVEAFIRKMEIDQQRTFLYAVDVPVSCYGEALEDLAYMGLTASTMFPGLDGVGRMIRHQMSFRPNAPPLVGIVTDANKQDVDQ